MGVWGLISISGVVPGSYSDFYKGCSIFGHESFRFSTDFFCAISYMNASASIRKLNIKEWQRQRPIGLNYPLRSRYKPQPPSEKALEALQLTSIQGGRCFSSGCHSISPRARKSCPGVAKCVPPRLRDCSRQKWLAIALKNHQTWKVLFG